MLSYLPDVVDASRIAVSPLAGTPAGTLVVRAADLGKLEARLAIEELARRFPRLQLSPGQQFTFHPNISFRGPQEMRVRTG